VDEPSLLARIEKRYAEEHRPDDDPEVFKTRLAAYNRQTAPLLPYYEAKGCLTEIDGMASVDVVAREIDAVLARCGTQSPPP
jgi:adenylate kinase